MSDVFEEEATYFPGIFNVSSEEQARDIVLTREEGQDSRERWLRETPYLTDLILSKVELNEESFVLDYGCGVGRISKDLIIKTNCTSIGVDISPSMRGYAATYVHDDNFFACPPKSFERIRGAIWCDLAVVVWVLQHCLEPEEDLRTIISSLYQGGKLFVVNNIARAVPTMERGWVNDGINIRELIKDVGFRELEVGQLDSKIVPKSIHELTFWGLYEKP